MFRKFIVGIGVALMGSMLWVPASVHGWAGTLTLSFNSIHCTDLISGGTRQTVNDGAASCSINIKEIATACVNKAGNADSTSSHIFAFQGTPISESQAGSSFLLQKNGSTLSDIFFSQADIQAALGSSFPNLDPAVLCPNKNWQLKWGVTRYDMVATVNNVLNGYFPVYPNLTPANASTTVFASCNPTTSGLTYSNGTLTSSSAGILSECWLFRNKTFVDTTFNGADLGGVALLDTNFTPGAFYNGVCQEHAKQTGSLGNVNGYSQIGPSPTDLECTGGDTVLDGTY